ncbi:hypothetical protein M9Y10_028957 [Tritrichomonas musculus]|uniref:RAVE complex protein Rav1 C-terminal domain-containing protein n=1 Tax=Tritrichomonas musculus TaxID=1915356 RepID=A0ABR2KMU5_9EUKA
MYNPISKTQIIGISSNSREVHAYTSLLQHGSTLFAFGAENLVFIYDRQSFKQSVVATPDPSSPLVALAFCGYGSQCKLICVNTNSTIYVYSMSNLKRPVYSAKTDHKPVSITATNQLVFYQTEHSIFIHPADFSSEYQEQLKQNVFVLTDTNTHQRCLVSPCGRALATFTRGLAYPVIYYPPFKKKRCAILPLQAKILDFQWGTSEHLIAITADDLGNIRLWTESTTSYELHCVKWFHFDSPILSAAICVSTDIESQTTQVKASSKYSDLVFPLLKRHPVLILALLDSQEKNVCLLQETADPHLENIASATMPLDEAFTTICDLRRIFSNHIIKRLISVTRFSRETFSFFQFELGGKSFSITTPFQLDFIKSPVVKILKYKNPITIHKDGTCYDWKNSNIIKNVHSIIELIEFKKGEISVCPNSIQYCYYDEEKNERKKGYYNLSENFEYATIYTFNNNSNAMIVLCNLNNIIVVFFDGEKFTENSVMINSEFIRSATIHSTDLFAVSTDKSVDTYIFNSDHYEKFASYITDSPCAVFIPHPFALIAITFKQLVKFFVVWRDGFIPVNSFDPKLNTDKTIPKIRTITLINKNALLAATKSCFAEINIPKSTFPLPVSNNSDYILLTSFSLAFFYPLFERLNGRKLTKKSYDTKMSSESFSFPSDPPEEIPQVLKTVCHSPPPNWGVLDDEGQRFLFSWIMTRNYSDLLNFTPLFAVWALLSQDQSSLISSLQITSFQMFCDTLIPIWAKDKNILTKAITVLVTETVPKDNEVEDYLFLCILLGRINIAKRIARIKHRKKLETFLSSPHLEANNKNKSEAHSDDTKEREKLLKKMEKSAYEAQKMHRFSLSAMFFLLRNMHQQAFIILKKMKMLHIIACRILDKDDWPQMIEGMFLNDFYSKYWTEKLKSNKVDDNKENFTSITQMAKAKTLTTALFAPKEAIEALREWKFQRSEILSIELHRYLILKKFDALQPNDILGLQMTPGFLKAQLDSLSNSIETVELNDSTNKPSTSEKVEKSETKNNFEFNFGMDDANFDDFDYDDDEYNQEEEEDKENIVVETDEEKGKRQSEMYHDDTSSNKKLSDVPSMSFSITAFVQAASNKKDQVLSLSSFSEAFFEPPFESTPLRIFTYNENFIMYLISRILNNTFSRETVKHIAHIANDLFYSDKHVLIVLAIIYALSYALSRPSIMLPIFQKPLVIDSCHFFIQQLSEGIYSVPNDKAPNILRNVVSQEIEITEGDRLLANFITLHEFCIVLSYYYSSLKMNREEQLNIHKNRGKSNNKNNSNHNEISKSSIKLDPFHKIIPANELNTNANKSSNKLINSTTNHHQPNNKIANSILIDNNNNNNDNNSILLNNKELNDNNENSNENNKILNDDKNSNDVVVGGCFYDNGNDTCLWSVESNEFTEKQRIMLANYKVISFFHHLHRYNFDHLQSTTFTNQSFLQDLVALGISCWDLPDEMRASQIDKNWMISLDNPFISPFYFDDHFQASKSFEIATRLEGRVIGICLDRYDPNFVAICNNEKVEVINISSRKLKNSDLSKESLNDSSSYIFKYETSNHSTPTLNYNEYYQQSRNSNLDSYIGSRDNSSSAVDNSTSSLLANENMHTTMMFDSPFVADRVFESGEAVKVNKFQFFKKRDFTPLWMTDHTSFKEVNATCIAAHPSENYFFIGSMSGRVYLASFDVKRNDANNNKKKITSIKIAPLPQQHQQQASANLHSKDLLHSMNQFLPSSPTSTMMPNNKSSSFGRGTLIVGQSPTQSMTSTFTYSMRTNKMTTMSSIRTARASTMMRNINETTISDRLNSPPIPPSKSMNITKANNESIQSTLKPTKPYKVAKSTMNSVCFYDGCVTSIKVNMTGDKILTTCDNGYVFLSDFQNSANLFVCSPRVSACWLNEDTQILVWDPASSSLLVYDTNAGLHPVASFKLPQRSYSYCPMDINGSQVVTGYADGSVVMVDLKNNEVMQSINVHKSPVSVLKFDNSGRFFISGSADNNIKITNAKVEREPFELSNAFSDYDVFGLDTTNSAVTGMNEYPGIYGLGASQRGVLSVDITGNTLVTCGYSSNVHVWMVTDPFNSVV